MRKGKDFFQDAKKSRLWSASANQTYWWKVFVGSPGASKFLGWRLAVVMVCKCNRRASNDHASFEDAAHAPLPRRLRAKAEISRNTSRIVSGPLKPAYPLASSQLEPSFSSIWIAFAIGARRTFHCSPAHVFSLTLRRPGDGRSG